MIIILVKRPNLRLKTVKKKKKNLAVFQVKSEVRIFGFKF